MEQRVYRLDRNGDYIFGFGNKKDTAKTRYITASFSRRQKEYERSRARFDALIFAVRETPAKN